MALNALAAAQMPPGETHAHDVFFWLEDGKQKFVSVPWTFDRDLPLKKMTDDYLTHKRKRAQRWRRWNRQKIS